MARKETMDSTETQPSRSQQQLVLRWLEKPMQRGRPSCPCGFVGATRTIRQHRHNCETWKAYCCMSKWKKEKVLMGVCGLCGEQSVMEVDAGMKPINVCPHCDAEGFMKTENDALCRPAGDADGAQKALSK